MSAIETRPPLVSIGIPTFNRAKSLERALRSALAQTHPRLEVVVSDNASGDDTAEVCARWQATHGNLRVIRQPQNVGPARNFRAVLDAARGDFFLWLADDDWLDENYVEACLAELQAQPRAGLVAGDVLFHDAEGRPVESGVQTRLQSPHPVLRVLRYFLRVKHNSVFYGLVRRSDLLEVGVDNAMAADWLIVASLVARGELRIASGTSVHRRHPHYGEGGTSTDYVRMAATLGLPPIQGRWPGITIVWNVLRFYATQGPRSGLDLGQRGLLLGILPFLLIVKAISNPKLWRRLMLKLR
jgi:glycosyltransferase involved in cell wall biosynthesis